MNGISGHTLPNNGLPALAWHNCYDGGWQNLIVPEAFAHPAKFAYGLIQRIVQHGLERGYWKAGDTIGDPFGGVALGGIICGYNRLNWVGVELEERFKVLGNQNIDLHRFNWKGLGYDVDVRLLQGDSRQFARIVAGLDGCVSSPPYAEGLANAAEYRNPERARADANRDIMRSKAGKAADVQYGSTPGQIGRLPAGNVDGVISSPPYADSVLQGETRDPEKIAERERRHLGRHPELKGKRPEWTHYGSTPGQIGSLKEGRVEGVITSPPWESSQEGASVAGPSSGMWKGYETGLRPKQGGKVYASSSEKYGATDGQIGNSTGETYWQAMRAVYEQMFLAMKPGGVAAIVVKDYVKNKARVPLCDDTLKLLVSLGFEPVERVHAMLVKETVESTLFEGEVTRTKERKSFFRRLAEKKGSPRIDWEEVLFVRKPAASAPNRHETPNLPANEPV